MEEVMTTLKNPVSLGHMPGGGVDHAVTEQGENSFCGLDATGWIFTGETSQMHHVTCGRCERVLTAQMDRNTHWYDDREVLASVLARSIETSDIADLDTARYFVEKPWKYDELHAAWVLDPEYGGDPS